MKKNTFDEEAQTYFAAAATKLVAVEKDHPLAAPLLDMAQGLEALANNFQLLKSSIPEPKGPKGTVWDLVMKAGALAKAKKPTKSPRRGRS